jgi:hypothetical protein
MVAVPIYPGQAPKQLSRGAAQPASDDLTKYIAAGALVAGAAMMVVGNRRAGLVVAAAGTALAMLEEQELIESWWKKLPGYLSEAQELLDKVEDYMSEASAQGQKLQSMLRR